MKASKHKVNWILLFITIFLLFSNTAFAVDEEKLNRKITLDAVDEDISSILATIAKFSECNIVLAIDTSAEKDKGKYEGQKVTVHLTDVPTEQALALVVKSVGLSYRLIGESTFLVGEKDRIEEEVGQRSYLIDLNYVTATKIEEALKILPGDIVALESNNSLLIKANPETFTEIAARIEEIDIPRQQIEIRARLIEVQVKDATELGVDWSRLNHLTTILAEDPSYDGAGFPYGYSESPSDELSYISPHGELQPFGELPTDQYFQKMDDVDDFFHFSKQLWAFDITIDWLIQNNAANILTDTRLTAKSGESANIHIGETVPFVVTDKEYELQVEKEEVGIKLEVKPTVNKDGHITTVISPEVSSVTELVGGYVPRTKVRKVNTTVTAPNGSKIIVGGLLSRQTTKTKNKFPILHMIPFIGEKLFTHTVDEALITDLIIEITPRIVNVEDEQYELDLDSIDPRLNTKLIETK